MTHTVGNNWTQQTDAAAFGDRGGHGGVAVNNKLVVFGGYIGAVEKDDVWQSVDDGVSWTLINAGIGWGQKSQFACVLDGTTIWVSGGATVIGAGLATQDVWQSTDDGVSWTSIPQIANFSIRAFHGMVVHNNKLWIMGGIDPFSGTERDNIYSSVDGATWVEELANLPWGPRYNFGCCTLNGRIYIFGGSSVTGTPPGPYNDCWSSADGVTWRKETNYIRKLTDQRGFSGLVNLGFAYDGKMWCVGGSETFPVAKTIQSVLSSVDGRAWNQLIPSPGFQPAGFDGWNNGAVVVKGDRFYTLGGTYNQVNNVDHVWKSGAGPVEVVDVDGKVSHAALRAPDLHEPKGLSTAPIDTQYVADGAGSGAWVDTPKASTIPDGGGAGIPANVTLTTPTVYTPCTISVSGNDAGAGFTCADGPKVTYVGSLPSTVEAHFALTVEQTDAAERDIYVTWAKNGVVLPQYELITSRAQNVRVQISSSIILDMVNGDYLEVFLKIGGTGNLTVVNCHISAISMPPKS